MPEEKITRDLFDRWERIWHEGQYDLITSPNASNQPTSVMMRQERPDIRVVVYDHSFDGDRAWFRFAFKWTDPKTGEARSRAGMQSYRIEGGKLAETWLMLQPLGSASTDAVAQEHWTSPPPIGAF